MELTKKQFLKKYNLTEKQFIGEKVIIGDLDLNGITSLPEGFNPIVDGYIYLNSLKIIPEGFNPIVDGYLDLNAVVSLPEGFSPIVGSNLYLDSLKTIPEGFSPIVGSNLYLNSLKTIPEGFNPIVGWNLYLDSVEIFPKGFNKRDYEGYCKPFMRWERDGKTYIKCDFRFSEVVSEKGKVFKLKDIGRDNTYYLVTDGNGKYAHGDTIKEAKADLNYKINDRDKSSYIGLDINKKLTFEECIEVYRVITGSCGVGVRKFIESKGIIKKGKYSVKDISLLTKNNYGNEMFNNFFKI